jgi:hypothetical protein
MCSTDSSIHAIAQRFDAVNVQALVLVGSFARGDAGPFSDIDLLRFVDEADKGLPGSGTYLIDGRLVNVSNVTPTISDEWFAAPEEAVNVVAGLRAGQALLDRDRTFAVIQERAQNFVWDAEMQQRANVWASKSMVGWIEEAHKGLEGLRRNDIGRMLNAQFGLSWGLSRVMQVQRGVLIASDNSFFDEIAAVVGVDSEWATLQRIVFGVTTSSLPEQIRAGLRLYLLTATMLVDAWQPQDDSLIAATASRINTALNNF